MVKEPACLSSNNEHISKWTVWH